ncbi:trypco2 family protein [Streptomyces sp. NPDC052225]|uniref:trypco2 family protein n=1 Tax=Streptomyces sp. NPDC052225 TaxID=3154949 RepID=UPI00343250D2
MREELELAAAVQLVRDELQRAAAAGARSGIRFEVGTVGMEFAVEMHRDASAKAGFKAWVVSGEAQASAGRSRTHTVSVTLVPKRADGTSVEISHDQDPLDEAADDVDGEPAALFTPPSAS